MVRRPHSWYRAAMRTSWTLLLTLALLVACASSPQKGGNMAGLTTDEAGGSGGGAPCGGGGGPSDGKGGGAGGVVIGDSSRTRTRRVQVRRWTWAVDLDRSGSRPEEPAVPAAAVAAEPPGTAPRAGFAQLKIHVSSARPSCELTAPRPAPRGLFLPLLIARIASIRPCKPLRCIGARDTQNSAGQALQPRREWSSS